MSEDVKTRHGCVTAWLGLMVVANSFVALANLLGGSAMQGQYPDAPGWAFPVLAFGGVVNVVCAIALFKWKKWGFFGFCASAVLAMLVNLMIGLGIGASLGGLIGVGILFGVLQIGDSSAWDQLE